MPAAPVPPPVLDAAGQGLRVRVLGPLSIAGVDVRELRSRKARTALKVLAVRRGGYVTVDHLVDCLWPDGDLPAQPEREVAVNLSRVRGLLGGDRVERTGAGYRLVLDWLDLDDLDALAAEARRRLAAGDHAAAHTAATGALALVRGPLLADEADAPWLDLERAAVARTVASLRGTAADAALHVGALADATALAGAALADDPYDEAAARVLMRAHVAAGRPGSALATYAEMRHRLADDLGASPAAETEALHDLVLRMDTSAARAPVDTTVPALPGRAGALAALAAALERSPHGLQLVVVEGEAGSGKTRLLETFGAVTERAGGQVLHARCDELGRALPLQPFADILAGRPSDLTPEDHAALAPLLGVSPRTGTGPPGPGMSTEAMQAFVFAALARAFGRLAATGPTVVLIDDLHLAGPSTLGWLQFARRRAPDLPLLVVGTRRADEGPPVEGADRLRLGPLDLASAAEIVGDERAASLHERSGGNPLLLVELAAADDDELPDSIRAIVAERLTRAGPEVAATVRAAAILGPDLDLELLASVRGRSPLDVLDDLEHAVRRQFLDERTGRFVFRHALLREALETEASAARRVQVHRLAAQLLAARPGADPLQVAHHARAGDEPVLASRALQAAARLAADRYDLAEAERLLDDAVALADAGEVRLARGHVRAARADLDGAEQDGIAAIGHGRRAEGLSLRAWVARHRHDMESAIRLGTEGAAQAEAAGDATTRASCLLVVAFAHRGLGDLGQADERMQEAIAGADAESGAADLGLRGWLGVLRVHQGRVPEALDLLEPALGAETDTVHGFWVEHVLQMTAHAQALRGRPAAALAILDRMRDEMTRRGSDVRYAGADDNYRAWILANVGDPRADECSGRAVERGSTPEIVGQATLDRAAAAFHRDAFDDAASLLVLANEQTRARWFHNRWRCEQRATFLQSLLAFEAGDAPGALALAERLLDEATHHGDARYATLADVLLARGRHRTGRPVDLDGVGHRLEALAGVAGLEAWWLTAQLAADLGNDRWWSLADRRVVELAADLREAGDAVDADAFEAHARRRFDRLGRR